MTMLPTRQARSDDPTSSRPDGAELVVFLAGLLAFGAAGVDMVLPSFGALQTNFDLPNGSNRVALTVTAFFLGMATGGVGVRLYG